MADFTNSISMDLPIPTVGTAPGPEWATLLNNCLTIVDAHSHVPGSGVPITPSAININADLTMAANNLTDIRSVRFTPQLAALGLAADIGCLYEVADDLYYNDGSGNQIRLTQSGSIVGTAGSITGLPSGTASASYVPISSKFVWQSATNIAADMDMGAAIMRNVSPNSTFALTLQPPAGLGSNYSLTLPTLPASTRILSLTSSGVIATGVAGTIVTADIGSQQVTTATIADLNITTGKIADEAITQDKLALRSVGGTAPAGGVAESNSSGTFTTSSTTYVQVTNLAVILTTTGRPVSLFLAADNTGNSAYVSITGFVGALKFSRDGAVRGENGSGLSSGTLQIPPGSFTLLDFPAAGTYTYSVQIKTGGAPWSVVNCRLVAYEI